MQLKGTTTTTTAALLLGAAAVTVQGFVMPTRPGSVVAKSAAAGSALKGLKPVAFPVAASNARCVVRRGELRWGGEG